MLKLPRRASRTRLARCGRSVPIESLALVRLTCGLVRRCRIARLANAIVKIKPIAATSTSCGVVASLAIGRHGLACLAAEGVPETG